MLGVGIPADTMGRFWEIRPASVSDVWRSSSDVMGHPKVGASWEGFAIDVVVRALRAWPNEIYFWALHTGAQLDLLVVRGNLRVGFEIKRTTAPRVTPAMRSALDVLQLQRLYVVHAGEASFPMGESIQAIPLARVLNELEPLR